MPVLTDRFRVVHVAAICLAAIALPWSEFLLSNAQLLLVANWFVEGVVRKDLVGRFKRAFTTPVSLVFISFFLLHALGMLWTSDLEWGSDLCRILLPVLVFGVILSSTPPLKTKEFKAVLLLGAWSAVASTIVCMLLREEVIGQGGYRELSVFISHIRLALILCFSVAVFVAFPGEGRGWPASLWPRIAHVLAIVWILFFLDRLSSLMGIVLIAMLAAYGIWRWSAARPQGLKWTLRVTILVIPMSLLAYAEHCRQAYKYEADNDLTHLEARTAGGEWYHHDTIDPQRENGHRVWLYIANGELDRGWSRRSGTPLAGHDTLRSALIRYMTSLGLRKDSLGLAQLSDEDVGRVEQGVASARTGRRDPLRARVDEVLFEFERFRYTGDPNGRSVVMRSEFLRTGWRIAKENIWTGVGTGDTRPTFKEMYARMNSPLNEQWRLRAHNEYLTLLISFGVFGLLWSLFAWLWPAWKLGAFHSPLFIAWLIIFLVSCLNEDTIETQMGATFFGFWYGVLVFAAPKPTKATDAVT